MTEDQTSPLNPFVAAAEIEVVEKFDIDVPFVPELTPQAKRAFRKALAAAQAEFTAVTRSKQVVIKPRDKSEYTFFYAELADVIAATKSLAEHGISVSQPVVEDKNGVFWLYTILAHEEGGGQVTRLHLMGSEDLKAFGGQITYIRRYCFAPAVGIASEDDDDSNGHGGAGDSDFGGYRRERDEPVSAPPPAVQRKPASKAAAPQGAGKASEAPVAPKKALAGAVKNLLVKVKALGLSVEAENTMLTELGVKEISLDMLNDEWVKVNAEVDRRMAG